MTYWSNDRNAADKKKELFEEVAQALSKILGKEVTGTVSDDTLEFDLEGFYLDARVPDVTYRLSNEGMFRPYSQYPFALRDVAVWTPLSTKANEVEKIIREASGELLNRVDLFDTFEKEGSISYAFRLVLQARDRTLNEAELTQVMEKVYVALKSQNGFEIR